MGDLQIHKQEIVQNVSGGPQKPQEVLNSAVEQQRQVIIEGMKQDLLKDGVTKEKINTLKFDVVGNIGVIINSKGFLHSWYKYSKENGVEYYTNFPGLQKDIDLSFALRESGLNLKDGRLYRLEKEIPQFLSNGSINPEFVRGIDDINFYSEIPNTFGLMKSVISGEKIEFSFKSMYLSIVRGVMRIKDVMYFAGKRDLVSVDKKGTKLTDEEVKKLLKRAVEELPNQCSDTRFLKNARGVEMGMEVTKQELDEYLKPTQGAPLITQKMYDECLRRIEARDRKIEEINGVKEQGKTERDIGKTQIGVVGKVKSILGF